MIEDYRPLELMLNPKLTKSEFTDFIGIWPNFLPKPLCNQLIEHADQVIDSACTYSPDAELTQGGESVINSSQFYGGDLKRKDFAFMLDYSNRLRTEQVNSVLQ